VVSGAPDGPLLAERITGTQTGRLIMRPFGRLTDEEIAAIEDRVKKGAGK